MQTFDRAHFHWHLGSNKNVMCMSPKANNKKVNEYRSARSWYYNCRSYRFFSDDMLLNQAENLKSHRKKKSLYVSIYYIRTICLSLCAMYDVKQKILSAMQNIDTGIQVALNKNNIFLFKNLYALSTLQVVLQQIKYYCEKKILRCNF